MTGGFHVSKVDLPNLAVRPSWTDRAGVGIAIIAVVISSYFSHLAYGSAQSANATSTEALELAQNESERRLSSHFFVGEAPRRSSVREGAVSVINANTVDIFKVWVEGYSKRDAQKRRKLTIIYTVQSCTGYELDARFQPTTVHFFDGTNYWARESSGELSREKRRRMPARGQYESHGTFDSAGCRTD